MAFQFNPRHQLGGENSFSPTCHLDSPRPLIFLRGSSSIEEKKTWNVKRQCGTICLRGNSDWIPQDNFNRFIYHAMGNETKKVDWTAASASDKHDIEHQPSPCPLLFFNARSSEVDGPLMLCGQYSTSFWLIYVKENFSMKLIRARGRMMRTKHGGGG